MISEVTSVWYCNETSFDLTVVARISLFRL